ncbi:unnamed protein product, partial [marine sediment metagenome]
TSHEISKVELLTPEDMRSLIDDDLVRAHRKRALSPDNPVIRGTAQNPDVFFQARETVNPYYLDCPDIVQKVMEKFEKVVGRKYELFQYFGAPDAERIIILMCSGAETAEETVEYLMKKEVPKNHFTIGINDDVTHTSISYDPDFSIEPADRTRAVFYGLGSDGTVGANKNSITFCTISGQSR